MRRLIESSKKRQLLQKDMVLKIVVSETRVYIFRYFHAKYNFSTNKKQTTKKQNKIEQKTSRVNPYSIKGPTDGDFIELGYNGKVEYQSIQTDNSFVRTLKTNSVD